MAPADKSKRICLSSKEKLDNVNPNTLRLFKKYKIDMELRELSPKTILNYANDLEQWFIYIYDNQSNVPITEITEDDLTEFFYFCKMEGNNTRRIRRRMSSISAFYIFLKKKRLVSENPMDYIDRPKKDVDVVTQTFLTKDQVSLMKKKLKEYGDLELETYALLSLSTMARVNAVSSIRWEQIDFEDRTINDVLEKEGYRVTLYFSSEVKDLLLRLKESRQNDGVEDGGYVFRGTNRDGHISPATLTSWTKKIGLMIGVPTLHPHDFRHSQSQLLKLAGMDIEDISTLLNHSGTDVTVKHYLRPDKKKVKELKDKFE